MSTSPVSTNQRNQSESSVATQESSGKWLKYARQCAVANPIFVVGVCAVAGGLILYAYLLGIPFMPDFALADIVGVFAVAFLTGLVLFAALAVLFLLPAFILRRLWFWMEDSFQQRLHNPPAPNPIASEARIATQRSRGHFVVVATAAIWLAWAGIASDKPRAVLGGNALFGYCAYLLMLAGVMTALWSNGFERRRSIGWGGHSMVVAGFVLYGGLYFFGPTKTVLPWASVVDERIGALPDSAHTIISGAYDFLLAIAHAVSSYAVPVASGIALIAAWQVYRIQEEIAKKRTSSRISGAILAAQPSAYAWTKLVGVVACFVGSAFLLSVLMFYMKVVPAQSGLFEFLVLAALATSANWIAFASSGRRHLLMACLLVALLLLHLMPMVVKRPLLLPEIVVRAIGQGGLRLGELSLDGKHCAILTAYGVQCPGDESTPIVLENVNLLSRVGGSLLLELLVDRPEASDDVGPQLPTAADHSQEFTPLRIPAGKLLHQPCHGPSALHTLGSPPWMARRLRCVRLVVPKEDAISYSLDGWIRYEDGWTWVRLPQTGGSKWP